MPDFIEQQYKDGFFTADDVQSFVPMWLTQDQADEILTPPEAAPETIPIYPDMEGIL